MENFEKVSTRENGSQMKVLAQDFTSPFTKRHRDKTPDIKFDYFKRNSKKDDWELCETPPPLKKGESREEYITKIRPDIYGDLTQSEIIKSVIEAMVYFGYATKKQ